jgi:hypothetical protein
VLFLEFGPMNIPKISFNPFSITYLLAHRLERFMMVVAVPLCGIIGISLSKLVSSNKKELLIPGAIALAAILAVLFINNMIVAQFWYDWQYYPESITLQAADFLRPYAYTHTVYIESRYGDGGLSFAGANLASYMGYPDDRNYVVLYPNESCNNFLADSYIVWTGTLNCSGITNVLNITVPSTIPEYIINSEGPGQVFLPTNVYHKS